MPDPGDCGGSLTLRFTTDWHVGTGAGIPGLIDRLVSRDPDHLPQVPAKSLFGLWRDAAQRLAFGLDNGAPGSWSAWVEVLFGSEPTETGAPGADPPRAAALSVTPARLAVPALRHAGCDPRLKEALTFVKPGVRIGRATGRAMPGHLRFIEMAMGGLSLRARWSLETTGWTPAQTSAARHFLAAALLLIDAAGAGRRRGQGACTASMDRMDRKTVARALDADPRPLPKRVNDTSIADRAPDAAAGWRRQTITVRLLAPLVVADGVRGNVTTTRRTIPGAMLLAALFPRFAATNGEAAARRAVSEVKVRFLEARASVPDADGRHRRSEPAPLVLHAFKEGGSIATKGTIVNLATEAEPEDSQGNPIQTKPLRAFLLAPPTDTTALQALPDALSFESIATALITHNTVDDAMQRPLGIAEGGVGPGVYSYEAIVCEGPFLGELRLGPGLRALPAGTFRLRLGRSRKDDYGLAEIAVGEPETIPSNPARSGDVVWLRLLSDTLPLGAALEPSATAEALCAALSQRLGKRPVKPLAIRGRVTSALRIVRHEGWQTRWGLPRPTLVALAAGSVIGLEVEGGATSDELAAIEADGLGDRRAEGFGEIRFDDPLVLAKTRCLAAGTVRALGLQAADPGLSDGGADDAALCLLIQEIAWTREIALAAMRVAADAGARNAHLGLGKPPSASQLGRLRDRIGTVQEDSGRSRLIAWLGQQASQDATWVGVRDRITVLLQGTAIWSALFPEGLPPLLPGRDDGAALRAKLWPLAFRHFAFAALRAHGLARGKAAEPAPAEAG
jgi:CRISPR-associated protein Csx10